MSLESVPGDESRNGTYASSTSTDRRRTRAGAGRCAGARGPDGRHAGRDGTGRSALVRAAVAGVAPREHRYIPDRWGSTHAAAPHGSTPGAPRASLPLAVAVARRTTSSSPRTPGTGTNRSICGRSPACGRRLPHDADRRVPARSSIRGSPACGTIRSSPSTRSGGRWCCSPADVVVGTPAARSRSARRWPSSGRYLLARELVDDPRVAAARGAGDAACRRSSSIQSGIYLGYLFTLGLGLLFADRRLLRACAPGERGRLVVGRPAHRLDLHDPAVRRGPLGRGRSWSWPRGRTAREPAPSPPRRPYRSALGFLPLFVATLAYNRHVTGAAHAVPDHRGRPARHVRLRSCAASCPPSVPPTTRSLQAVRSSGKQARAPPALPRRQLRARRARALAAVAGAARLRARRSSSRSRLAFPLGYFFFWGMFVSSSTMPLSGPIYYIPVYRDARDRSAAAEMLRLWDDPTRRFAVVLVVGDGGAHVPVAVEPHRRQPPDQRGRSCRGSAAARRCPRIRSSSSVARRRLPAVPQPVLVEPTEARRLRALGGGPRRGRTSG